MKALVVDDSAVMRKIARKTLEKMGISDVDEDPDGNKAVISVMAEDYDIVLMDWNMPNMLGIDAVKKIRENDKTTPIIMVTTEAEKIRVVESIKAGVNGYISKPFTPEALISIIKEILGKS